MKNIISKDLSNSACQSCILLTNNNIYTNQNNQTRKVKLTITCNIVNQIVDKNGA